MEIRKEFLVDDVIPSRFGYHKIVLRTKPSLGENFLYMDNETCKRHGIDLYNIVRNMLVCAFSSCDAPVHDAGMSKGEINRKRLHNDDVLMLHLRKTQTISRDCGMSMTHTAALATQRNSNFQPIPYYEFNLELDPREYEACAKVISSAVFRAQFHVVCNKTHGGVR